jgi:hypothetical protein
MIAALMDGGGNFIAGRRSELEQDFKETTFDQFTKTGFTAALTAVAQDGVEGKLAAASGNVLIK